jgi:hypothetical protein
MIRVAFAALLLAGCGNAALKHAGQTCSASSECDKGLLCDTGQNPPVCAGTSSGTSDAAPMPDAAKAKADAKSTPDARKIDAPMIDAPAIDATPADAPTD